jgi:hypothetical protein
LRTASELLAKPWITLGDVSAKNGTFVASIDLTMYIMPCDEYICRHQF